MCRCIKLLVAAALVVLPSLAVAADTPAQLTLDRAIAIALEQNPEFRTSGLGIAGRRHRKKPPEPTFCPRPALPTRMRA